MRRSSAARRRSNELDTLVEAGDMAAAVFEEDQDAPARPPAQYDTCSGPVQTGPFASGWSWRHWRRVAREELLFQDLS